MGWGAVVIIAISSPAYVWPIGVCGCIMSYSTSQVMAVLSLLTFTFTKKVHIENVYLVMCKGELHGATCSLKKRFSLWILQSCTCIHETFGIYIGQRRWFWMNWNRMYHKKDHLDQIHSHVICVESECCAHFWHIAMNVKFICKFYCSY